MSVDAPSPLDSLNGSSYKDLTLAMVVSASAPLCGMMMPQMGKLERVQRGLLIVTPSASLLRDRGVEYGVRADVDLVCDLPIVLLAVSSC